MVSNVALLMVIVLNVFFLSTDAFGLPERASQFGHKLTIDGRRCRCRQDDHQNAFRSTHAIGGAFKQRSASSQPLAASALIATVDSVWRNYPYIAAALTCGFKASAADLVAQKRQVKKRSQKLKAQSDSVAVIPSTKPDLKRNVAYLLYGALYQGATQEYVYNHIYPALFGVATDIPTVLSKVCFDLLIQTTIFTLPIAYMSKALIYRYSFGEAFRRYLDDIRRHGLLKKYYLLWGPIQCITFSVVPEHWRISFVACVSFFWLIILSSISSKSQTEGKVDKVDDFDDDTCDLLDGQTCNIDG